MKMEMKERRNVTVVLYTATARARVPFSSTGYPGTHVFLKRPHKFVYPFQILIVVTPQCVQFVHKCIHSNHILFPLQI